jgi:hypothetical protein
MKNLRDQGLGVEDRGLRILEPVVVPGDARSQHRAVVVKSVEAPVAESAVMPPAGSRKKNKHGARFESGNQWI